MSVHERSAVYTHALKLHMQLDTVAIAMESEAFSCVLITTKSFVATFGSLDVVLRGELEITLYFFNIYELFP